MLLCLFISTSHAEEMSLLSCFNPLLQFLLPGDGNLLLSSVLPCGLPPKDKIAVKNNKRFLSPFASRAATQGPQQTFKTTVSVMTIKLKRLEFKMLWRMSGLVFREGCQCGARPTCSMSKDKEILVLNLPETLNRTGGPLIQQVILLSVCLLQGQANFILRFTLL